MKRRHLCAAVLALTLLGPMAWTDPTEVARAGLWGFGGPWPLTSRPDSTDTTCFPPGFRTLGNVDAGFDLKPLTTPFTLDWYPFLSSFHLSAGILVSTSWLGWGTRSSTTFDLGGPSHDVALRSDATYSPIAPYVGLGWSSAFGQEQRWGIVSSVGLAFLGRPHVSVAAAGPGVPASQPDLDFEEGGLRQELDHVRFYPVASVSLFFRF